MLILYAFIAFLVVMVGWREHKQASLLVLLLLLTLAVWGRPVEQKEAVDTEPKRKVYSMLVSIDMEDQAQLMFKHGLDRLELINAATEEDGKLAGLKAVHWRHIRRAAREALQLPAEKKSPVSRKLPSPTPIPIPASPPGTRRFVMQPNGPTRAQIAAGILKPPPTPDREEANAADQATTPRPLVIPGAANNKPEPEPEMETVEATPKPPPRKMPGEIKIPDEIKMPSEKHPVEAKSAPIPTVKEVVDSGLDDLVGDLLTVKKPKSLKSLKPPSPATSPPKPTMEAKKTGKIVIVEAATQGADSFTCTFDAGYSELGAEVGETAEVLRFENINEAKEAGDGKFTLLVKEPILRMANNLKRYPPDCLYPTAERNAPRKNPLETYLAATSEMRASCEELHNRLTKVLSGQPFDQPLTKEHYDTALKVLSSMKNIVVLESIEQSMEMLQKTQTDIRSYIMCKHFMHTAKKNIPSEVILALEDANNYDAQLYLYASRIFEGKHQQVFGAKRKGKEPCPDSYTPVCWDGVLPPAEQRRVPRDNVQELLVCQDKGCKASRGRDIICTTKKCNLEIQEQGK